MGRTSLIVAGLGFLAKRVTCDSFHWYWMKPILGDIEKMQQRVGQQVYEGFDEPWRNAITPTS